MDRLLHILPPLLEGAVTTIGITLGAFALALALGLVLALASLVRFAPARWLIAAYVELFRNTPVLTQLFVIYFGLAAVGLKVASFPAAILGLGLNGAAVLCEVFRSAIAAIHHGQREAALAAGMTPLQSLRFIVLPQTWRISLPPVGNYAIGLLKDTAIVSAIAAPEIIFRARNLVTETFETTLIYLLVALIYFALSFPLSHLVARLERRERAWQR